MSIIETEKIDIIASRPDSPIVKLVITDHLTWNDLDIHTQLIQDKINTYLEFVESGQLRRLQIPRIPESPEIHIALVVQYPPSQEAELFLARVREFLARVSVYFEIELRKSTDE